MLYVFVSKLFFCFIITLSLNKNTSFVIYGMDIKQDYIFVIREFQDLAIQLLEICYHADDDATKHLLTYELKHWSRQTCLSLALAAKHRDFIAHPCVQLLLNDLWMGGLSERKNSGLKVIHLAFMFCISCIMHWYYPKCEICVVCTLYNKNY